MPADRVIVLSNLAPWGDEENASEVDLRIADEMSWLPTTRDQEDPFYLGGIDSIATDPEKLTAAKDYRTSVYKALLAKLRGADFSHMKAGPTNFTQAAKGAAAFAFRNAATEIVFGIEGKWVEIAEIYLKGHWPCGITKTGELVVF